MGKAFRKLLAAQTSGVATASAAIREVLENRLTGTKPQKIRAETRHCIWQAFEPSQNVHSSFTDSTKQAKGHRVTLFSTPHIWYFTVLENTFIACTARNYHNFIVEYLLLHADVECLEVLLAYKGPICASGTCRISSGGSSNSVADGSFSQWHMSLHNNFSCM